MKKLTAVCALALALTMALAPAAYAAEWAGVPHASPANAGRDGEQRSKGASIVFAVRRKRS